MTALSPPGTASIFDERTMLSLRVPDGWTVEVVDPAVLRFAPPDSAGEGRGAVMTVQRGTWHKGNVTKLERLIADSATELERLSNGFQLEREERYLSSSLSLTYVRWYRRVDDDGTTVAHLQALIGDDSLYLVNALAPADTADTYLPRFEAILRSIRVIADD